MPKRGSGNNMGKVRVDLQSVEVLQGQGVAEGKLELIVMVSDGNTKVRWPQGGNDSVAKVRANGLVKDINQELHTYTIPRGEKLNKSFEINVIEVDKGLHGLDDEGTGTVVIKLEPNMRPIHPHVDIVLKRPRSNKGNGKVRVTLAASDVE